MVNIGGVRSRVALVVKHSPRRTAANRPVPVIFSFPRERRFPADRCPMSSAGVALTRGAETVLTHGALH